jgi:Phosphorylase superfamily
MTPAPHSHPAGAEPHPDRKEIARFLLGRGQERLAQARAEQRPLVESDVLRTARAGAARQAIVFPDGLAPTPVAGAGGQPGDALPHADVVLITWTVDELAGLARVFTPGVDPGAWQDYDRHFAARYREQLRPHAPAANSGRLGSYQLVTIGDRRVLCMKSELHLNQDGVATGQGTATLPVKAFFQQVIEETKARYVLSVGTAGSVFDAFGLGDVIVTRAAKFKLSQEFRNEPFNGQTYTSDWPLPTARLAQAETLMAGFADELALPAVGAPAPGYPLDGELLAPPTPQPKIRLDGRDMPAFHPILTTDYFEYGTTVNRLDHEGAGVEMGDAALGLACSELADPPYWGIVRNMSDPVINGALPAKEFHLNEQTTWAVGFYTAYGKWTSVIGALATWGIVADLPA